MKQAFLSQISTLPKYGTCICFERLSLAIEQLRLNPLIDKGNFIVITGTNGKGSTSTIFEALSRSMGKTTALFTSPHFVEFNERFRLNGEPVDYQSLNHHLTKVLMVTQAIETDLKQYFGAFEILFLLALVTFSKQNSDLLIFEAGIGGRYDPVRLLKAKLTALTSVDLEHTELLGNSLPMIACDKLDACAPGGQVVLGQDDPTLLSCLSAYGELNQVKLINAATMVKVSSKQQLKICFGQNDLKLKPSSALYSQADCLNLQTALALVLTHFNNDQLIAQQQINWSQAITQCQIPGRFEQISTKPSVFIDAAHTPAAFNLLFSTIKQKFSDKPMIFIIGLSKGRDINALSRHFSNLDATILVTQAFKGMAPQELADKFDDPQLFEQPQQALIHAKQLARQQKGRVFVVGGLFLAGTIAALEKGIDPQGLYLY